MSSNLTKKTEAIEDKHVKSINFYANRYLGNYKHSEKKF